GPGRDTRDHPPPAPGHPPRRRIQPGHRAASRRPPGRPRQADVLAIPVPLTQRHPDRPQRQLRRADPLLDRPRPIPIVDRHRPVRRAHRATPPVTCRFATGRTVISGPSTRRSRFVLWHVRSTVEYVLELRLYAVAWSRRVPRGCCRSCSHYTVNADQTRLPGATGTERCLRCEAWAARSGDSTDVTASTNSLGVASMSGCSVTEPGLIQALENWPPGHLLERTDRRPAWATSPRPSAVGGPVGGS